jgi:hypothetical protein
MPTLRVHSAIIRVSLMVGLVLLGLSVVSMVMAFKSAQKADDYGFPWWWIPLLLFTLLSFFLAVRGLGFLGRFDEFGESEAVYIT